MMIFIIIYECEAKGGRGGGFSRGSSSGGYRSSPSYSRPSPSYTYSRPSPSPSYTYSRPSPSYTYSRPTPSPSHTYSRPSPAPSHTYSRPTPSPSHTYSRPSPAPSPPSYGWNPSLSSGNTGSKTIGWNPNLGTGTNTGSKTLGSNIPNPTYIAPPPAYRGLQNQPVPAHNQPPAYSPSYVNPPSYSPSYTYQPSYTPSHTYQPSHTYRPSYSQPSHNYQPSYNTNNRNSPSYGSGSTYRQQTYNTHSSNPSGYSNTGYGYGNTFGSGGLPGNTYISNNYYGNRGGGNSGFLTNALYYGAGTHHGYMWGNRNSYRDSYGNSYGSHRRRDWDEDDDRRWRGTTKAPYFENKVPGEDKILPASAVIGAATAFGLISLLPLNVPPQKPLMYCNNTDLAQSPIRINNGYVYYCINNTIEILCPPEMFKDVNVTTVESSTVAVNSSILESSTIANTENLTIDENSNTTESSSSSTPKSIKICETRTMLCDTDEKIYCHNGTLFSKSFIFCNSTTLLNGTNENETITLLNCYEGEISQYKASFIPTTTTAAPTTTEKSLSFSAKAHVFFLHLIGKSDVLERTTTTTTPAPTVEWIPEALTMPPETTTAEVTTSTEPPFDWYQKVRREFENGTNGLVMEKIPQNRVENEEQINRLRKIIGEDATISPSWIKVYRTTTTTTTEAPPTTTTERPYDWMIERSTKYENGSYGSYMDPVFQELVDGVNMANQMRYALGHVQTTTMPSTWIKVYRTEAPLTTSTTEATSTTEEAPFDWMMKVPIQFANGTFGTTLEPVEKEQIYAAILANKGNATEMPLSWIKVYKTDSTTQRSTEVNSDDQSSFIAKAMEKIEEVNEGN